MSLQATDILIENDRSLRHLDRNNQFHSFLRWSGMCVASLDHTAKVIEANIDLVDQFGRASRDVCGRHFCELLHPSMQNKIGEQFSRLTSHQKRRFVSGIVGIRPDESTFSGEIVGIAVKNSAGCVENIMVLVRPDRGQRAEDIQTGRKWFLTDMDRRVLEGVASGMSTIQLASTLYLSRGGVEYHVTTLLRKFKVGNRPALVSKAYSMGLFHVGSWPPRVIADYLQE